ncbi:hypothetical protein K439DRAFT_1267075, partial [Ramaria rubella]
EAENEQDLVDKLCLCHQGQYFWKLFQERARFYSFDLPSIRWNADNMFVGTIQGDVPLPPSYGSPDTQSLFYNTILKALLIDLQGSKYHKFSGNEQVGINKDKLGMVVDAFAHSIVIHSNKEYLLVDLQGILTAAGEFIMFNPQGHSEQQNLCRWDQGISAIEDFLFQHTCNEVCHTLELDI